MEKSNTNYNQFNNSQICFLGCGAMGGAIVRSICKYFNPASLIVSDKYFESAKIISNETKCNLATTNKEAVSGAKYIFLAVKPFNIEEVLLDVANEIKDDAIIISMAAGVSIKKIKSIINRRIVRIMPNMPALVGEGMIALCYEDNIDDRDVANIFSILECSGKVKHIKENLIDAVTAISGSGPAYVFMFIEALADAAVRCGLSRKDAYEYASQTVKGSAIIALSDTRTPSELKDAVCSPSGTTIEAVAALEKNGFRNAIFEAVKAAYEKSINMGK